MRRLVFLKIAQRLGVPFDTAAAVLDDIAPMEQIAA